MSSVEAEYVAATRCCASILWMKSQLSDYDIHYKMVHLFYDNTSAIVISNNPVLHLRTKHIDIRYHFIRDHILKGDIVLSGNSSSTEQVNSIQQLLANSLITGTEVDVGEIIYSDLDPSKVTNIELTVYMIDVNNQRDSMSPSPLATKIKKGKSQTVTSTLPKSQGLEASRALSKKRKRPKPKNLPTKTKVTPPKPTEGFEQSHSVSSGTVPDTQDLERDIQLASTTKTTSRPEGSLGDKDLGGNIQPANMEPIYTSVADPSGTGAKYQNFAYIQAYLLSKDELDKESDEEEVLAVGDDMDEDIQAAEEVRTPLPKQDQPEPSQEHQEEAAVSYVNLKASIDEYYNENLDHRDQTDKLMEAPMSSLDRSNTTISDLYKGLDVITQLLKDINNAVKDDPDVNQKINEATKTFTRLSSNITKVLSLVKGLDFSALLSTVKDLQAHALKQEEASTA
ncbi:hypothetical protein Tco_1016634 [Tanacetum coccineum]|uniref:Retrovirus-related Pol polyprotein from transposon TNT 1-94 n=1 Tax=Tanacetum coccineum TaxID=301880 RepID=A0ABQ5FPU1_9ASTR